MDEKENRLKQLERRAADGLIKITHHPTLPLNNYSYTKLCQFEQKWDKWTVMARGLVLHEDGSIVARCFEKFWNMGEKHCPEAPNLPFETFEKIDGSLLLGWNYEGKWHVSTRGSFDNEYVDYGKQFLPYFEAYPKHYTIHTEICLPVDLDGMPRAVQHSPGIYLLGAVDNYSSKDVEFDTLAQKWLGYLPKKYGDSSKSSLSGLCSLEGLQALAKTTLDTEGWVVRFRNGVRMKVKTAWFAKVFRSISKMEKNVRQSLIQGLSEREILRDLPEELHEEAKDIIVKIRHYVCQQEYHLLRETLYNWHDDRLVFVRQIASHPDRGLLMALYDNEDIRPRLMEKAEV